jgi:hypothetical protein
MRELAGPANNQHVANAVAAHLRSSGSLHKYAIDVTFADGTAELTGQVTDPQQREEAVRLAHEVAGVTRVSDRLTVSGNPTVLQVQAPVPPVPPGPPAESPRPGQPPGPPVPPPLPLGAGEAPPLGLGMPGEPMPIFQPHAPLPGMVHNAPPLPPYAWPTYAPYNNYSRVAAPNIYPYQSWPFIGPMYPFPKVPLGWRSVKLTWEDGNWWYARVATGHDWWRIRYW